MDVKRGGAAVKEHAVEAGIDEDLSRIIAAFGGKEQVKDIAIFTPGKLTYISEPPQKVVRVRPGGDGAGQSTREAITRSQEEFKKRIYK